MRRLVSSVQPEGHLELQPIGQASASKTLAGAVLASMRSDILELRLAPGSKLPFKSLRERYDAGFSPLRELLSRLAEEGLVIGEDQRGFRVAPLTVEDFIDLTTCGER